MSIIRTAKDADPYARIDNRALRDKALSWKARGLLAYLLSMPDNWETNIEHLAKQGPDGRAAVSAGLKELQKAGYLHRQRVRGESGRMSGWESVIHEQPQLKVLVTPKAENPTIGKPDYRETRESENRLLRTTEVKNDLEEEQTNIAVGDGTSELVAELCALLADAVANHGAAKTIPRVTDAWIRDMGLLLRRGPKGSAPCEIEPARVARCIGVLFSELNEPQGETGFCWADQVQSPTALRKHWTRIANAARAQRNSGSPAAKRQRMLRDLREPPSPYADVVDIGSRSL